MHKFNLFQHNWLALKINNTNLTQKMGMINGIVYDLGCGIQPYKEDILKIAEKYIAVDWSASYHNTKADIIADLNKPLPINAEVADTIVSLSVLEHLCEPQQMLGEAYRIIKPQGTILLQVPWQWWIHEAPYDYFRYTPYGLQYMLEKAGFVDIVIEPQAGFFTMWILKINYFSLRFVRGPKFFRGLIKAFLIPFWFIGQVLAPILDKIDHNWAAETSGYTVVARKKMIELQAKKDVNLEKITKILEEETIS
jgi:SAM-dependent methyltransferase